jgi:hypothetical protein
MALALLTEGGFDIRTSGNMAKRLEYLPLLSARIERAHQCYAVHRESVHVHEMVDGQTVWKGEVEVFDLIGHAEAKICYAWWYEERDRGLRVVTVLEKPPIDSPAMAVKFAIFFDAQPAPYLRPESSCEETTT